MSTTPKLLLAQISQSQSQKAVTMTADLRMLDYLVQPTVINQTNTAPPGSPSDGDTYIVAASPTGAWTGQAKSIAYYNTSGWIFSAPSEGWQVYDQTLNAFYYFDGTNWSPNGAAITFATLAVNGATTSTTNRLAVASQAVLLTHDSSGANQTDCQIFINKSASGATAGTQYQDAFTTHAQVGLCGDDNFHFKVSPDGSTFFDALVLTNSNGNAAFLANVTISKDGGLVMGSQTSGASSHTGTLTNCPNTGNPSSWLPITVNGTLGWIPWWHA